MTLRVGLVGSGFMGEAHARAFRAVPGAYRLPETPVLELLADRDEATAAASAARLGFARATGDWRGLVSDPAVDLVAIAAPNILHAPVALAAIAASKPVYCEKPLATTLADARAMTEAAERAGISTAVGFTYLHNPIIGLAREIIASGEIGEVTAFRGIHAEDFMASPQAPWNWRCDPENAGGALADIGSHIIAMARLLVGEIEAVSGLLHTAHRRRQTADGEMRAVAVDDQADAVVRFSGGAVGTLSASWIATGRSMGLAFEISGTRGALSFTQQRLNELRLHRSGDAARRDGFVTIEAGPVLPDYAAFCPAAGHQLGYNDLKTIEAKAALDAIAGRPTTAWSFRDAWAVERVAAAIRQSSYGGGWVRPDTF